MFFRAAETALHGPALSEDHRDFAVAVHGYRRPCCSVEQDFSPSWRSGRFMVQTVRRTFFFHSCSTRWPMVLVVQVEISQLLRGGVGDDG